MTTDHAQGGGCGECPLAGDRRAFLRTAALAAVGALVAAGARPGAALAATVRAIVPDETGMRTVSYGLPATEGVAVDAANDVILARWRSRVYAFSIRCPHRGARLEWHADEGRIFCPKHRARFGIEGAHASGRRTRALDRYELRRQGSAVVVQLDALHRADQAPAAWSAAVLALD